MRYTILSFIIMLAVIAAKAQQLPCCLPSGDQGMHHVQGFAYDALHDRFYLSFTTRLVVLDSKGKLVASVEGLTGHLGDLALDAGSRILYGSIEYKHDAIGNNIQRSLGKTNSATTGFYIAMFPIDSICSVGMSADYVMRTAYLNRPVEDYLAKVENDGRIWDHRYGCSGIDGVALAPGPGKRSRMCLYVAYGIYGELERTDNDNQVILCYDTRDLIRHAEPLMPDNLHTNGPRRHVAESHVPTGNTTFGIQNLTYDAEQRLFYAAVYPGKKPQYPNYGLFTFGGKNLQEVKGYRFPYGSTGFEAMGDGLFYVSHNERKDNQESTTLCLYRWTGNDSQPLKRITE